jgi:hypothetical protein
MNAFNGLAGVASKVALSRILATVAGAVLGNVVVMPPAIIVDMLAGEELTNLYNGNLTLSS